MNPKSCKIIEVCKKHNNFEQFGFSSNIAQDTVTLTNFVKNFNFLYLV